MVSEDRRQLDSGQSCLAEEDRLLFGKGMGGQGAVKEAGSEHTKMERNEARHLMKRGGIIGQPMP